MSTAEHPDALARRLEQLAAGLGEAAVEAPREAEPVAPLLEGLRAELGALRAELASVRAESGAAARAVAAREDELRTTLRSVLDQAAGERAATQQLAVAVRGTLDALTSALADEDARAARQAAVVDAGLDRVRAQVTSELAGLRSDLSAQLAASSSAQTSALETRVEALTSAAGATQRAVQELRERVLTTTGEASAAAASTATGLAALTAASDGLRRDVDELGTGMVSATTELVAELRARGAREAEHLRTSLEAVRTGFDARAEELSAALSRGLLDIAEEVDVATTTTRDAASRVSVLAELTESQRTAVERLLREVQADVGETAQGLREELRDRTSSLQGGLGARLDDVEVRLTGVDGTLAGGAVAAERVAAGLDALTATAERLAANVDGFRTEWPTRTYEVVEGARAVGEGLVLDVRAEVGARLDDVRAVLERVVGTVDLARSGLHDGTDRLAQAGAVLVAYLEHRDRLLEAERDRVLHDVLDAFAAGLSARERSALAGRVTDAVVRRRDARDAERYRAALGEPVTPTAELPDDVRRLGERVPERPSPPDPEPPVDPGPDPEPVAAEPPVRVPARPRVARRAPGGTGGSAVVPGPGRDAAAPARRGGRTPAPSAGRGRLGAMPEAPRVDLAVDAASSPDDDRS